MSTQSGSTQTWAAPVGAPHCNFHRDRAAEMLYAGTPLCSECCIRVGRVDPRSGRDDADQT
ncbi:MAG: hypothetical protein JWP17_2771 [Solirubrobacterales bacterium]|nr:hypothetical protein [Solirubrobacterales bacterium]